MSKTILPRSSINVGQTIYAYLKLESDDIVPTLQNSSTSKRILKGLPVKRMDVVLRVENDRLKVAYLATFAAAQTLASTGLDSDGIKNWYPIKSSPKEGVLEPLDMKVAPSVAQPQWTALRTAFDVTDENVEVLENPYFDRDAVAVVIKNLQSFM